MLTRLLNSPIGLATAHLLAYIHGLRDGINQPHELRTSTNVEEGILARYGLTAHDDALDELQNTLDRGINHGQAIRSPKNHQRA